ncbi:MAG: hypothetical protein A07HB70_00434, partial [uncultured archaeon A07HB70]
MTTRPRLRLGSHLLPALAALALFCVAAALVLTSTFGASQGFPADANVVASIGRAMFGLGGADVPARASSLRSSSSRSCWTPPSTLAPAGEREEGG